jgi:DNA primase
VIRPETIEQVRAGTDVVELVSGYVPLKKVGRNWRGLCPFHTERSPSFYVSPERQTYHCFGCGAGGSVINFVMALEKLEFPEAVKLLGKRLGIAVETDQTAGRNQAVYDACEQAAQFYEQQLGRSEAAQMYVRSRGLSSETVRRFRLGFAPGGNLLRGLARKKGLSEDGLVRAGLLASRENGLADYFHSRLMFPLFSLSGKVIGFGGRVLDSAEPKYLNSPDTAIFRKGENLYGAFQAKGYLREEPPLLVEGNFDLLSLVDAGLNRVVAPLGTALTPAQAQLLRRYNNRTIICFDGDASGAKAARRAVEVLLAAGIDPTTASLPGGEDPDSFIRKYGPERLSAALTEAADFVALLTRGRSLGTVAEQRAALGELTALLRSIPDDALRELYANRIADRFRVDKSLLLGRPAGPSTQGRGRKAEGAGGGAGGIEEKLLAASVQAAELGLIAREYGLADIIGEGEFRGVARLVAERCGEPGFGPGMLLDLIEDEALRQRVAGWTFGVEPLPGAAEFRERMQRLRAEWLHRRVAAATAAGDELLAAELTAERNQLLKDVTRERSSRQ